MPMNTVTIIIIICLMHMNSSGLQYILEIYNDNNTVYLQGCK